MNEEQLADILAQHLDALLAGEALPESIPDEIAHLWPVAQELADSAPAPRLEFGLSLKERLQESISGSNGTAGAGSSFVGTHLPLFVIVGFLTLVTGLALLIGAVFFGIPRLVIFEEASPMPPPVQTQQVPVELTRPSISPSAIIELTPTNAAIDSLSSPTPSATLVLDILPPITVTVETGVEIQLLPELAPGSSTSGGDEDGGGGGRSGDHDRGHGNDPDHHDEDNPGHGRPDN